MKLNKLFWGVFLLVLGGLILINYFIKIDIEFDLLFNLWPLILILVGLKILVSNRLLNLFLVIISAILVSLFLYAFLFENVSCQGIKHFRKFDRKEIRETISQPILPSIKKSNLNINFNLGKFSLRTSNDKLIEGEINYSRGKYHFDGEVIDSIAEFKLITKETSAVGFINKKKVNNLSLFINSTPEWDIHLQTNFVDNDLNFNRLNLNYLNGECNFSKGYFYINPVNKISNIDMKVNFSNFKFYVPDSIGILIKVDKNFSSFNYKGIKKVDRDTFQSENYEQSNYKIKFILNSNFSKINVIHQ